MKKYFYLVQRATNKVPFKDYIQRLSFFLIKPNIGDDFANHQQREHSFIDLFNGLGLLTVIVSLIILYDRSFNEFKIVLAFNPLFIIISWITNALIFSIISSGLLTLALFCSKSPRKYEIKENFYNLFTHGMRCYAASGLFLGIIFVKACGVIFLDGLTIEQALSAWYWQIYILVLAWFLFRIIIYPYYKYSKIFNCKFGNWIFVVFLIYLSFEPLKLISVDYSDKMIDKITLCELFKKGRFIENIPQDLKAGAITKVCPVT